MIKAVLRVKDWKRFQHYKHRSPPWIKLHREILDNRDFQDLTAEAAIILVNFWLLASENEGSISYDSGVLAWRLRKPIQVVREAIQLLIRSGFVEATGPDASAPLALGLQGDDSEKSREEKSRAEGEQKGAAALRELIPEQYRESLDGLLRSTANPGGAAASIRALGPGGIHERFTWEVVGRALFELVADKDPTFNTRRLEAFCRKLVEQPDPGKPRDNIGEQLARIRGGAAA